MTIKNTSETSSPKDLPPTTKAKGSTSDANKMNPTQNVKSPPPPKKGQ